MTPQEFRFFRRYLREWAEGLFLYGAIDSNRQEGINEICNEPEGKRCAKELFARRRAILPRYRLRLRLKRLREIDGRSFYHIEVTSTTKSKHRRRTCFVGHRFIPSVTKTLRWNLRQVLEPYNIHLDWSGRDISSRQIFDDIVQRIKKVDFCIFDNRSTGGKPNVYIEAGIAYALKTPFILFEYVPTGAAARRTASIPSDLAHALALRYKNYEELFRQFYSALPVFVERNLK